MSVSVLMTTYNGEKYIFEQLNSIYQQTHSPNEVVIYDDRSNDNTVSIINNFIKERKLNNWFLFINRENKGWQRNFIDAMKKVSGEIIFLCDQDDIWFEDKIENMVQVMKKNHNIKCLSGNIVTIDDSGELFENKNGYIVGNNTNKVTKVNFNKKFNAITLLGCTMCLRKEVADIISDINVKNFSHDAQVCRLSTILDGLYLLDRKVIKYRIHQNNTSGIASGVGIGSSNLNKRKSTIAANIQWLEALMQYYFENSKIPDFKIEIISKTIELQKMRYDFLTTRKLIDFIRLYKYRGYYSNISMLIGDLAYCYGINKITGKGLWFIKSAIKGLSRNS
ncbi:glycosyltransferase [Metabacillus indicus]|uniref:glycosyltransferase n=1 Tax=Metabacillus indicus TaxID=246786 RepID=UPI002493ADD0|nr:glycosyltransferase [Metabacillus indicus]